MDWIVPLLFFLMDGFGIRWLTKVDMSLNKETKSNQTFFRMGTFIDSTLMKLVPFKVISSGAMHLLYRSNNFWKAPWKSSCVSVSMTFVTASFISSIVS